jgi:hypothetical protein
MVAVLALMALPHFVSTLAYPGYLLCVPAPTIPFGVLGSFVPCLQARNWNRPTTPDEGRKFTRNTRRRMGPVGHKIPVAPEFRGTHKRLHLSAANQSVYRVATVAA